MYERAHHDRGDGVPDGFGGRAVFLGTTLGGAGRLTGDLTAGCAAALSAVLESLGKRAGPEDIRSAAQRRHDALEEACRRLIAAGMLPGRAGQPTQIQLHMTLSQLREPARRVGRRGGVGGSPGSPERLGHRPRRRSRRVRRHRGPDRHRPPRPHRPGPPHRHLPDHPHPLPGRAERPSHPRRHRPEPAGTGRGGPGGPPRRGSGPAGQEQAGRARRRQAKHAGAALTARRDGRAARRRGARQWASRPLPAARRPAPRGAASAAPRTTRAPAASRVRRGRAWVGGETGPARSAGRPTRRRRGRR